MRAESGMTLIEVMVAALVLVVGVLGTLTMLDNANKATSRTKAREAGTNLAREVIEAVRSIPYPNLTPATFVAELQSQPGLADINGDEGWNVRRRNVAYTVEASVCTVDDNTVTKDGLGTHGAGTTYCAGQPELAAGQAPTDSNPDDYKRVVVELTWPDGASTRRVRQEAVINNPGSAFAPAIKSLTHMPTAATASTTTLQFTAITTSRPEKVLWSVDGIEQGQATGSQTTWNFPWKVNTLEDGTYDVGAQAFDEFGESGTGRTATVVLNRFYPKTPAPPVGGYNGAFGVELEWTPNTERDVIGYRVYRTTGTAPSTSDAQVCETSIEAASPTSCQDTAAVPGTSYHYYVRAVAPAHIGVGLEQSPLPSGTGAGKTLAVSPGNNPPSSPRGVTAVRTGEGVTLTWNAASDSDGSIRYYRLYRDGQSYGDRLDRTNSGANHSLVDGDPGESTHRYWVTAVDDKLAESAPAPDAGIVG